MKNLTEELTLLESIEQASQAKSYVLFENLNDDDKLFSLQGDWYTPFIRSLFPHPMPGSQVKEICNNHLLYYTLYGKVKNKQTGQWTISLDTNQLHS